MKRLLTALFAVVALPVLAQVGGFTKMGTYHPLYQGGDPPVVLWAGYTNNIDSVLTTGDDSGGEFAIISLKTLTNFPPFAPDSLDMKYGTYYGTNGLDFPFGAQTWNVNVGVHLTNNPGWMIQEYNDASTLPIRLSTAVPKIYFMSFVATVGGWGGGSNTTMYYQTNCYGCQSGHPGDWIAQNSAITTNGDSGIFWTSVAADPFGNSVEGGQFGGTVFWGTNSVTTPSMLGPGGYIVKRNSAGNALWSRRFFPNPISSISSRVYGVACDSAGNIIVGGEFGGTMDFGGTTNTSTGGSNDAAADIFVAKYNSNNVLQWVKAPTGFLFDSCKAIALDTNEDIIASCSFMSSAGAGGALDWGGGHTMSDQGVWNVSVAKLSKVDGSCIWATQIGGGNAENYSVATDKNGDVYVGCSGARPLSKLAGSTGVPIWTNTESGTIKAIGCDPNTGNVFVYNSDRIWRDFNGAIANATELREYTPAGNQLWGWTNDFGDVTAPQGGAIAVSTNGTLGFCCQNAAGVIYGNNFLLGNGQMSAFMMLFTVSGNNNPQFKAWRTAGKDSATGAAGVGSSCSFGLAFDSLGRVLWDGIYSKTIYLGGPMLDSDPANGGLDFLGIYHQ